MHDGKDVVSSHAGNLYRRTKNQKPLMIALQLTFFKMALPDIKLSVYSLPHKYREEDLFLGLIKNHLQPSICSLLTLKEFFVIGCTFAFFGLAHLRLDKIQGEKSWK